MHCLSRADHAILGGTDLVSVTARPYQRAAASFLYTYRVYNHTSNHSKFRGRLTYIGSSGIAVVAVVAA